MKQEELGQRSEMHKKNTPCITERSNDADTRIGSASVRDVEKAGRTLSVTERSNDTDTCIGGSSVRNAEKAGRVHSLGSRHCYETKEEKCKFIRESFQLDSKAILNEDAKLKEEVIQLFLDNF